MSKGQAANTSQRHGEDMENLIRTSWMFHNACNAQRMSNAVEDIAAKHDIKFSLATSIKCTGSDHIGMADATRFYEIASHRRFMVATWTQIDSNTKEYGAIHEFIIPPSIMKILRGEITAAEILEYHRMVAGLAPGEAGAKAARAMADLIRQQVKGRTGHTRLDFKIDDKKQRRLQASIRLSDMIAVTKDAPDHLGKEHSQPLHVEHRQSFHQYPMPIRLLSPPRRIVPASDPAQQQQQDTLFEMAKPSLPIDPRRRILPVRSVRRVDEQPVGMDAETQQALFG